MKNLLIIAFSILTITTYAQNFEGKIVYKNTYESKIPNVTTEQLTAMMGTIQNYEIKDENYKSTLNGSLGTWQLYIGRENKLYSKASNSDVIYWNDAKENPEQVLKIKVKKSVTKVLGYLCDEVTLTCKSGIQKYYYSTKLSINPSLYSKHLFGNWYDYVKTARAVPLKIVIENPKFNVSAVATEIKRAKLSESEFRLPANAKTAKSSY